MPPRCRSSTLRQRQAWLMGGRKTIGQQNSNNHMKQTAAMFSPKLRSLSLSPAVLACQEGKTKSISPASLTFLCAGVGAAGGTDRKISKHTCCWWGHARGEAAATAVREREPPSGEPAIAAGLTLRHLRLELTLERKRASETQRRCAAVCVLVAPGRTSRTSDFPISDQVCAWRRYTHTPTCKSTQVDSLAGKG